MKSKKQTSNKANKKEMKPEKERVVRAHKIKNITIRIKQCMVNETKNNKIHIHSLIILCMFVFMVIFIAPSNKVTRFTKSQLKSKTSYNRADWN